MESVTAPNLLASYLDREKLSYAAFARLVGDKTDRARIARAANSYRRPGLKLALAIEQATKGAIPASYWPGLPLRPEPSKRRRVVSRRTREAARQVSNQR